MVESLNIPFVSESYDRLMAAQAAFRKPDIAEPVDTGDKLRAARTKLGMTQAALAARLGITAPAISNMETGAEAIRGQTDLAMRYLLLEART